MNYALTAASAPGNGIGWGFYLLFSLYICTYIHAYVCVFYTLPLEVGEEGMSVLQPGRRGTPGSVETSVGLVVVLNIY